MPRGAPNVRRHISLSQIDDQLAHQLAEALGRDGQFSWVISEAIHALNREMDGGRGDPRRVLDAVQTIRGAGHAGYRSLSQVEKAARTQTGGG